MSITLTGPQSSVAIDRAAHAPVLRGRWRDGDDIIQKQRLCVPVGFEHAGDAGLAPRIADAQRHDKRRPTGPCKGHQAWHIEMVVVVVVADHEHIDMGQLSWRHTGRTQVFWPPPRDAACPLTEDGAGQNGVATGLDEMGRVADEGYHEAIVVADLGMLGPGSVGANSCQRNTSVKPRVTLCPA